MSMSSGSSAGTWRTGTVAASAGRSAPCSQPTQRRRRCSGPAPRRCDSACPASARRCCRPRSGRPSPGPSRQRQQGVCVESPRSSRLAFKQLPKLCCSFWFHVHRFLVWFPYPTSFPGSILPRMMRGCIVCGQFHNEVLSRFGRHGCLLRGFSTAVISPVGDEVVEVAPRSRS